MRGIRTPPAAIRDLLKRRAAIGREEGIGLVEVLVALSIMGSAVVMFLSSLSTGSKAVGSIYERTTAANVARSQLEYTKSQDYTVAPASYDNIASLPPGFTVSAEASAIADKDNNIQRITVTVYRDGEPVFVKEDYKVNR
jgi:type II secretory pathway pseudopilin PulG